MATKRKVGTLAGVGRKVTARAKALVGAAEDFLTQPVGKVLDDLLKEKPQPKKRPARKVHRNPTSRQSAAMESTKKKANRGSTPGLRKARKTSQTKKQGS